MTHSVARAGMASRRSYVCEMSRLALRRHRVESVRFPSNMALRRQFAVLLLLACSLARAADSPVVAVRPSASPGITLDGRLNEPAWQHAPILKLTQQSPKPGEATVFDTEVRVVVTSDRLYFGFTCHDPQPNRIAVHGMQRDGNMSGDDTVSIVLDTYGDRRTGYFFQVNAAGARVDGLIANAQSANLDWDGVWDVRTQRTADGWTAEIVIPTRTLSFARGLDRWGLNLERFIARERTTLRWSSPTLDSFLYDLSRAGGLSGLGELQQGLGLEFSPYVTGRSTSHFGGAGHAWQAATGGDFTWKITPQLVTVFTANTDFAETEVDARQINLTRFPLFFPEKRAFFLEGTNQYEFGLGLSDEFIPFFSRRIGLLNGDQIPIDAGVKLNGRVGRWNVAALDVQTRDSVGASSGLVPGVNLFAGRVSYDLTEKFRVGTIVTNGDPQGFRSNRLFGFDAVYRTSNLLGNKNFFLGAWTARNDGDVAAGDRQGWGFKIDYPNDLWDCGTSLNQYGEALDPALGFLPRPGTRQLDTFCTWQPRPRKDGPLGWIRQEFFENEYRRVTNTRGQVESWSYFMAPINVRMETGDRFEFNWYPHYEFLAAPFEIAPGVVIPPGEYPFTRWRFEAQSSAHRAVQGGTTTWFGTFYDGHLTQQENYVRWTSPSARWQLDLSTENDFARLREGNFVQRLWQLKGGYAWSPNLVLTSFIQYDTESQNVGTNTRLRWTIRPGNDLFIVWNRGWQKLIRDPHDLNLVPNSETFAVKLRWSFRK
jgi:hypothetical protein